MNAHTPGPWRITMMGNAMDGDFRYQIGTSEKTVCYTYDGICEPSDQHKSNAALITAAPELLSICQLILNHPHINLTSDVELLLIRAIAMANKQMPS